MEPPTHSSRCLGIDSAVHHANGRKQHHTFSLIRFTNGRRSFPCDFAPALTAVLRLLLCPADRLHGQLPGEGPRAHVRQQGGVHRRWVEPQDSCGRQPLTPLNLWRLPNCSLQYLHWWFLLLNNWLYSSVLISAEFGSGWLNLLVPHALRSPSPPHPSPPPPSPPFRA